MNATRANTSVALNEASRVPNIITTMSAATASEKNPKRCHFPFMERERRVRDSLEAT